MNYILFYNIQLCKISLYLILARFLYFSYTTTFFSYYWWINNQIYLWFIFFNNLIFMTWILHLSIFFICISFYFLYFFFVFCLLFSFMLIKFQWLTTFTNANMFVVNACAIFSLFLWFLKSIGYSMLADIFIWDS